MPRVIVKTNTPISFYQIKNMNPEIGKVIAEIPGEKAEYVMAEYEGERAIHFGEDLKAPCASVEICILGKIYEKTQTACLEQVLDGVTQVISRNLNIPVNRIYAMFMPYPMWALEGNNIEKTFLRDVL